MVRNFEWERLHKKLEGKLSKLKQKRRQKSTKKTKADQIIEEVRKGHLSKAARKLQSKSGFRDLSVPENRETAKNLYPRSEQAWTPPDGEEIPDWKPAILEQDEFQSFDSLDLALRRLPKGRTPGLSGMSYEFVTLLCTDRELCSTLKELTVLITNQKLNETIHNIMATSLFIPLAKGSSKEIPSGQFSFVWDFMESSIQSFRRLMLHRMHFFFSSLSMIYLFVGAQLPLQKSPLRSRVSSQMPTSNLAQKGAKWSVSLPKRPGAMTSKILALGRRK